MNMKSHALRSITSGFQSRPMLNRRDFIGTAMAALASASSLGVAFAAEPAKLAFSAEGKGFSFNTGVLKGMLRNEGKLGLTPMMDTASALPLAGKYGIFSHYRMLDIEKRYGVAGWDWPSEAQLLPEGAVEVNWKAYDVRPFDMKAIYKWTAPNILDLKNSVTPKNNMQKFELFMASYFETLQDVSVYAKVEGQSKFITATQADGHWHAFPRDEESIKIVRDGRWKRPPNPVDWVIRPPLAGSLAMRRDVKSGLTALVMAPPSECFAICVPFSGEGHRSIYLSMFGGDLKAGEASTVRLRLVIGREITDQQAVTLYETYLKESPTV
jgi:hypothetical protein